MVNKPKSIMVFYDKNGQRHEYSNEPENCVVVKLNQEFYSPFDLYHLGQEIVIPKEVAQRINCTILGEWTERRANYAT